MSSSFVVTTLLAAASVSVALNTVPASRTINSGDSKLLFETSGQYIKISTWHSSECAIKVCSIPWSTPSFDWKASWWCRFWSSWHFISVVWCKSAEQWYYNLFSYLISLLERLESASRPWHLARGSYKNSCHHTWMDAWVWNKARSIRHVSRSGNDDVARRISASYMIIFNCFSTAVKLLLNSEFH